jgi:hypothetical protein
MFFTPHSVAISVPYLCQFPERADFSPDGAAFSGPATQRSGDDCHSCEHMVIFS